MKMLWQAYFSKAVGETATQICFFGEKLRGGFEWRCDKFVWNRKIAVHVFQHLETNHFRGQAFLLYGHITLHGFPIFAIQTHSFNLFYGNFRVPPQTLAFSPRLFSDRKRGYLRGVLLTPCPTNGLVPMAFRLSFGADFHKVGPYDPL